MSDETPDELTALRAQVADLLRERESYRARTRADIGAAFRVAVQARAEALVANQWPRAAKALEGAFASVLGDVDAALAASAGEQTP